MKKRVWPSETLMKPLREEVLQLHVTWRTFTELFFGDQKRYELLNGTAPGFFIVVQKALVDNVMLTIARLKDPSTTRGQKNLSLAKIVEEVESLGDSVLAKGLRTNIERIDLPKKRIETYRHKVLAHNDLLTCTAGRLVPGVKRKDVEKALRQIRFFMNKVDRQPLSYELNDGEEGVKELIAFLEKGVEHYRDGSAPGVSQSPQGEQRNSSR
jgi:hypothetical protein